MPTDQVTHLPYIDRDTYVGRWTRPAGTARTGEDWTAEDLHAYLRTGRVTVMVLWESFGHINGVEMFVRERVIADERGISVYNSDGGLTLVYPLGAGRIVRIMVSR